MSNCPYCGTSGAYNSGFSVACVSVGCKFFDASLAQERSAKDQEQHAEPGDLHITWPPSRWTRYMLYNQSNVELHGSFYQSTGPANSFGTVTLSPGEALTFKADSTTIKMYEVKVTAVGETIVDWVCVEEMSGRSVGTRYLVHDGCTISVVMEQKP